jgi:tRNA-binding EMAP/Myf-like protein
MYRLFYNYKVTGDILFVLLDPEKKVDHAERKGRVEALYADNKLVGINIFNVSEVFHLKTSGIIFAPEKPLLDVVNSMISEAGLAPLALLDKSGYSVAKIVKLEEHPIDEKARIVTLSLGENTLTTVSWYPNLEEGKFVVVALDGTIRYDGSVFHKFVSRNIPNECSICSSKELKLADNPGAFLVEGYAAGEDFFLGGNKK